MQGDESDIGHIYRSLKNSMVLDGVFNVVSNSSGELSSKEIASILKRSQRDVEGALIGDGVRYKRSESLEALGLAACRRCTVHGYDMLMASATDKGWKILNKDELKDYASDTKQGRHTKRGR